MNDMYEHDEVLVCPCGYEGTLWRSALVYSGSYYEPPEYACYCPECDRNWEEAEEKEYTEDE